MGEQARLRSDSEEETSLNEHRQIAPVPICFAIQIAETAVRIQA